MKIDAVHQILISVISSSVVAGLLMFMFKKSFLKYMDYYFNSKMDENKIINELKRDFLIKSKKTYEHLSVASYELILMGREILSSLKQNQNIDGKILWSMYGKASSLLENHAYISKDDFEKIHFFKNRMLEFIDMCKARKENPFPELDSFWQSEVEGSFDRIRDLFKLFSLKEYANR